MTAPQNTIEQALEAAYGCMCHFQHDAHPNREAIQRQIDETKQTITALRAMQDVKMRSANNWNQQYEINMINGFPTGVMANEFIQAIQTEAFAAGLMAQVDAKPNAGKRGFYD